MLNMKTMNSTNTRPKYETAISSDINAFVSLVNNFIENGYQLYGNPYSINDQEESYFCQAVILSEEKHEAV